jgi:preprotein translocase subunit YajC
METLNWNAVGALLAMAPQPTQPGTTNNPVFEKMTPIVMMVVMLVVMYVIMIRPQRQRQKQLDALLKSIKPGDKVLTAGGIVGVVLTVKERTVTLRSAETKLEVLKSSVSEITEKSGESSTES